MVRILVIEDIPEIQEIIQEMLTLEGFDLLIANNGLDGLDVARSETPDVVICDLMMPELDGYGFLEELQANPNMASVPVIVLSAQTDRSSQGKALRQGAIACVEKPFTRAQLLNAINQARVC